MFYLLRRYTEKNIRENHCQEFCRHWLSFLGLREGKTCNPHSAFSFLSLAYSLVIWTYSYLQSNGTSMEALHRVSLSLLALGLFSVQALRHKEIMLVAKQTDECFIYNNVELTRKYKGEEKRLFNSGLKVYSDVFTILVFLTWTSIQSNVYKDCLLASPMKPPPGMILPIETPVIIVAHHFLDTAFIVNACLADVIVAQFFMMFSLRIIANFKILRTSLETIKEVPMLQTIEISNLIALEQLNTCIKHHQILFRTFAAMKHLFDKLFFILYFSMMGAIAMCRTLITGGDIDVGKLLPLYYLEVGYIHIFCAIADEIAHVSDLIRFAAYSSEWYNLPRSISQNIRIMVIRASKPPLIRFYIGGSEISCPTFTMIVNASLTYFVVTILMDRQGVSM